MNKKIIFLFVFLCSVYTGHTQAWNWQHDTASLWESGGTNSGVLDNYGNMYTMAADISLNSYMIRQDAASGVIKWKLPLGYFDFLPTTLAVDPAGYVYLYYATVPSGLISNTLVIQKIDSSGTVLWSDTTSAYGVAGIGGYSYIQPWNIATDNFGHIYVSGWSCTEGMVKGADTLITDSVSPYSYIMKYDTAGNRIWCRMVTQSTYAECPAINITPSGDILIASTTDSSVHFANITDPIPFAGSALFVAKCDSHFNRKWITINEHTQNTTYSSYDETQLRLQSDRTGNAYLAGALWGNDSIGNNPLYYSATRNIYVAQYKSFTGNVQWVQQGGVGDFLELATNLSGHSYVAFPSGYSPHYFGDSTFSQSFPDYISGDMLVVGLDSLGNIDCGYALGGNTGDDQVGVLIDNEGYGYIFGDYIDSIKLGDSILRRFSDTETIFSAKFYCPDMLTLSTHAMQTTTAGPELYPNPTTGELFIKSDDGNYRSFAIYNVFGQQVLRQSMHSGLTPVDVQSLPAGVYVVLFYGDFGATKSKFVKM